MPLQNPDQLDNREQRDKAGVSRRQRGDQAGRSHRLPRFILREVAYQYVGVQPNHPADPPRSAMTRFISSIVMGLPRWRNLPSNDFAEIVAGMMAYFRSAIFTNSTHEVTGRINNCVRRDLSGLMPATCSRRAPTAKRPRLFRRESVPMSVLPRRW